MRRSGILLANKRFHMNKSIEHMMSEHRRIEQVLGSLATFAEKLQAGVALPREELLKFADFFKNYADRCHHGKEEERLFLLMNRHGFPREYGPVGVMLAEHTSGRQQVRALAAIGGGSGPLTESEKEQIVAHANEFISLLLSHIQKEDHVLYPMAEQSIPPDQMLKLDASCQEFDQKVVGNKEIERLVRLAHEINQAYPPNLDVIQAHAGCVGCAGHH